MKNSSIIAAALCTLILGSCSGAGKTDSQTSDATGITVTDSGESSESATEQNVGKEAQKALYSFYYDKEMLDASNPDLTCSEAMRRRFEEAGVTSGVQDPFSQSFNDLCKRYQEATEVGFDYDILWNTQDTVTDFDLEVTDVTVIDNDNVIFNVIQRNNGEESLRVIELTRENGVFRIDNIDDLRRIAESEMAEAGTN